MKADPFQIGDVLKDPKRFIVPIYQRTYTWTKARQWERFFDSLETKARERLTGVSTPFPHYMGALLLSPRGKYTFGTIPVYDVVDGQQRLTTFLIFLAAVRDLAKELGALGLAEQLATFLLNADSPLMADKKTERYKLQATTYDRALSRDLVDLSISEIREKYATAFYKKGTIRENAPLPLQAWWYFRNESAAFAKEEGEASTTERLSALSAALVEEFRVIVITLDDTDDAQVIFETLNSGGEPLAAMDLVRNDVFHRAMRSKEDPDALMERRWSVFEDVFWKQETIQGRVRKPRIDFFLAHTLAAETGKETLLTELYARYKAFVAGRAFPSVDAELTTLVKHSPTYRALVTPEPQGPLAEIARQLNVFDVSTAFPLVFVVAASDVDEGVVAAMYRLISSYIVRRALCGLTPKAYNTTFLRIAAHLRTEGVSLASLVTAFLDSKGDTVKFPTDNELRIAISTRGQYGAMPTPRLKYILEELEKASRDHFDESLGLRGDLTIEHVLPNEWAQYWPLRDGSMAPAEYAVAADDQRRAQIATRQIIKHSLGNLTLLTTSGNPRLGNLPYTVSDPTLGLSKREALRTSLLKMNQEIATREQWDEESIAHRADLLSERAIYLWPYPASML